MIKAFILDLNGIVRNLETISKQIEAHSDNVDSKSRDMVFSDAQLFIKKCQDMNIPLILKSDLPSDVVDMLLAKIHLNQVFVAIVANNFDKKALSTKLMTTHDNTAKEVFYDDLFEYPQDWQREKQLERLVFEQMTETLRNELLKLNIPITSTIVFESRLSCIEVIQAAHIPVVAIDREHKMDPSEQLLKLVNSFSDLSIESLLMSDQKMFGR